MEKYLRSRVMKLGLGFLIFGTGPLLFEVTLASLGLLPEGQSYSAGFAILAALTFWPSVITLGIGFVRVRAGEYEG